MADLIKKQYALSVLRMTMDRANEPSAATTDAPRARVLFELEIPGESVARIEVSAASLGLPQSVAAARRYHHSEPPFRIPDDVMGALGQGLAARNAREAPLWLELAQPRGTLSLAPWERLLHPLGVPVLRLPYFALRPAAAPDPIDVLVCASSPEAKTPFPPHELIEQFVRLTLGRLRRRIVLHVFTDQPAHAQLTQRLRDVTGPEAPVRLYDPSAAASYPVQPRSADVSETPGSLDSPWLRWAVDALRGETIDVACFFAHGYLAMNEGALAIAESPVRNVDRAWSRFVAASQLASFLTLVGANTLMLGAVAYNYSKMAMRALANGVAARRPGPVVLNDLDLDPHVTAFADALGLVLEQAAPPRHPGLSIYCHPESGDTADDISVRALESFTPWRKTPRTRGSTARPKAWVLASQRYLEQSAAEIVESESRPSASDVDATQEGIKGALKFAADVIERHATQAENEASGGGAS